MCLWVRGETKQKGGRWELRHSARRVQSTMTSMKDDVSLLDRRKRGEKSFSFLRVTCDETSGRGVMGVTTVAPSNEGRNCCTSPARSTKLPTTIVSSTWTI